MTFNEWWAQRGTKFDNYVAQGIAKAAWNAAVAEEREACAKACEGFDDAGGAGEAWAHRFAEVIRARSDKEEIK